MQLLRLLAIAGYWLLYCLLSLLSAPLACLPIPTYMPGGIILDLSAVVVANFENGMIHAEGLVFIHHVVRR